MIFDLQIKVFKPTRKQLHYRRGSIMTLDSFQYQYLLYFCTMFQHKKKQTFNNKQILQFAMSHQIPTLDEGRQYKTASDGSQPLNPPKGNRGGAIQINQLFLFLYFSDFVNSLLSSFYNKLTDSNQTNKLDFTLIITILKMICPVFGGFIVDHVQYSLNLLLMAQLLTILSYGYFIAKCFKLATEYLYFAIGFQVLAQQLQWIIVMTMICKQFRPKEIPKQISYFYTLGFAGRFVSFLLLIPIGRQENDYNLESNPLFLTYTMVIGIMLIMCTVVIYLIFPRLRKHAEGFFKQSAEIQTLQTSQTIIGETSLLQALKNLLNTDRAVVALVAGLIMSVVTIWQEYQYTIISYYFSSNSNQPKELEIYGYFAQEIPYAISIGVAPILGLLLSRTSNPITFLSGAASTSLLFFLMGAIVMLFQESLVTLKLITYVMILVGLQYAFSASSISSTTIIGSNLQNYQTNGFSFGLMSMFNNLFQVWILSVLIGEIRAKGILYIYQIQIICVFSLCFSFIAFIVSKVLQFVKQQQREKILSSEKESEALSMHPEGIQKIETYQ